MTGTWIDIKEMDNPGKKTKRFWVVAKESGDTLGYIGWYVPWRKYWFEPSANTGFEWVCMREISDFIEKETKEHYEKRRKKK